MYQLTSTQGRCNHDTITQTQRKMIENRGWKLMIGCTSWILEATPGERSWLNPNATSKRGVGYPLASR